MNNLNKSVKKDELEIDLPPNFNLYAEEEKNDEEIILELNGIGSDIDNVELFFIEKPKRSQGH